MTEETLFELARKTPEAERATLLDRACEGMPELRARVEALLRADAGSSPLSKPSPIQEATTGFQGTASYSSSDPVPGILIAARYTLVERIGEGGMGEVWVAKQSEPVKRRVALKLIKAGMDSKSVVQRFEQERQALAMMDHPNIAKVLDGGLTHDRRPYFVMELVNGLPLNKFCDEAKLGIKDRLELFVPICQAVQHAHQKGIVHRDLKPGNILVTMIDGKPVPKVIDFGVAKATGGKLTEESMSTQFGAVIGTLEYMSPEQAGFSNQDVDTRADIYSLGVILYELLTGLRPFDSKRLKQAALDEVIRIIREEEPSKPSTKLSTDESLPSLAAVRHIEPGKLTALLRGELDWVVMKCLEKQRDRRYETANGLAADVLRYLAGEPVQAHPPSAGYRLRKFVRRNRPQVIAAGMVFFALLAGMAGTTWGLLREAKANADLAAEQVKVEARNKELAAEQEKVQARFALAQKAIKTFHSGVSEDVLLKSDQHRSLRTKLLREAAEFYTQLEKLLEGQTDRRSRTALGHGYFELAVLTAKIGTAAEAMAIHRKALSVRRELAVANDAEAGVYLAHSLHAIAQLLMGTGDSAGARKHLDELLELLTRIDTEHPNDESVKATLARAHHSVGYFRMTDKPKVAIESFRKAADLHEKLVENNPKSVELQYELAGNYLNISSCLNRIGNLKEALTTLERARRIFESLARIDPEYGIHWAASLNNIASMQVMTGDLKEAMKLLLEARDICARLVQSYPTVTQYQSDLAVYQYNIALQYGRSRRYKEALAAYQEALATREKLVIAHPSVTAYQRYLADTYKEVGSLQVQLGQPGEALVSLEKALATYLKLVSENNKVVTYQDALASCLINVGDVHAQTGNTKQALDSFRRARDILQQLATDQPDIKERQFNLAVSCQQIGFLLRGIGYYQEAAESLRKSLTIYQMLTDKIPTVIDYQTGLANTHNTIGLVETDLGNLKEALAAYQQSRELHEKLLKANPANPGYQGALARNFNNIGRLHAKLGQFDEAFAALDRGLAIRQKLADADSKTVSLAVSLGYSHAYRGWAGVRAGRTAEAAKDLRQTLELWRKAPLLTIDHRFEIFRALALLAGLGRDAKSGVSAAEAKTYADQAIAAFADTVKAGWAKPNDLKEPDFDAVRNRDDFKKLLAELEKK